VFKKFKLGHKIGFGFILLIIIFVISVSVTIRGVTGFKKINGEIYEIEMPTESASLDLLKGFYRSLAHLRGWVLLGDGRLLKGRAQAWNYDIEPNLEKLKSYSAQWSNEENANRMTVLLEKTKLLKVYQQEIEDISGTLENNPAFKILTEDAAPKAKILISNITQIIELEKSLVATPERKELLGIMADLRGSMLMSLTNIRLYMVTGSNENRFNFNMSWRVNEAKLAALNGKQGFLNAEQQKIFISFKDVHAQFSTLTEKMFEIRGSTENDIAKAWLGTKAAPVIRDIDVVVNEMIEKQKELLSANVAESQRLTSNLLNAQWIFVLVGSIMSVLLGALITRSITRPIVKTTTDIKSIEDNYELSKRLDITSGDEVGRMGSSFNSLISKFEESMIMVRTSVGKLTQMSEKVSTSVTGITDGVNQQAESLEELSSSVGLNANNAHLVNNLAQNAFKKSEMTELGLENIIRAMKTIEMSSTQMSETVSTINGIADQINMLAVNAAIEVVRAGEHGKGFALVADDFKRLAERSTLSAHNIVSLIANSSNQVKLGVRLSDETGQFLKSVLNDISQVARQLDLISTNTQKQAAATKHNASISEANVAAVDDLSDASHLMAFEAGHLKKIVNRFRMSGDEHEEQKGYQNEDQSKCQFISDLKEDGGRGQVTNRIKAVKEDEEKLCFS